MQVNLRRGWFAPDGNLYTPEGNPHTFSAAWADKLPSTAEAFEEKIVELPKPLVKGKKDEE